MCCCGFVGFVELMREIRLDLNSYKQFRSGENIAKEGNELQKWSTIPLYIDILMYSVVILLLTFGEIL